MEECTVLIVGAGPSGLALGALLARMNVKTVILEKDAEVCEDPRGIVVNGDAVRISYQVGIGEGLTKRIGKDIGVLNFHRGNFRTSPYMKFDVGIDWAEQAVSNNIAQFQPNYEREIRNLLKSLPACQLRTGCEVLTRREEGDCTITEYKTLDGEIHSIRSSWLVGADGKRGVVRKKFLEPEGIRQEFGLYPYVGTWVAANLHITEPTPETHPDFPLWSLGYTPDQVKKIFWPKGFHFCNDSKRPAVSGRFGPAGGGFWRHEYSVEPEDKLEDIEKDLWAHIGPWLILPGSKFSKQLRNTLIEYPRDCIEVIRCRPFTFATKIVNKWFVRKTMLIGDAAHVFPPFGGQGIATGIRDAQALSWRLAMMTNLRSSTGTREKILEGWSQERRHAWNDATKATKLNGSIVNLRSYLGGFIWRAWVRFLWWFPSIEKYSTRKAMCDKLIYNKKSCPNGFFLENAGGGQKIAQIWVKQQDQKPSLSDEVILQDLTHLTILVIVRKAEDLNVSTVEAVVQAANLPHGVISTEDVRLLCHSKAREISSKQDLSGELIFPCSAQELESEGITPIKGYHETAIENRLGTTAKYVIVRPDFFVHSKADDLEGLSRNLQSIKEYFV